MTLRTSAGLLLEGAFNEDSLSVYTIIFIEGDDTRVE